eukprot:11180336-Lingulodinium_polyedra.AAC.1
MQAGCDQALLSSIEAKQALASARVARAYYPIVAAASVLVNTQQAKGEGKRGRQEQARGEQWPRPWQGQGSR